MAALVDEGKLCLRHTGLKFLSYVGRRDLIVAAPYKLGGSFDLMEALDGAQGLVERPCTVVCIWQEGQ